MNAALPSQRLIGHSDDIYIGAYLRKRITACRDEYL